MMDPGKMVKDPKYVELGPFALLATIQQACSRLLSFQYWPVLSSKLSESNNAAANIKPLDSGSDRKCFRCSGDHHVLDSPKKAADKKDKEKKSGGGKDDANAPVAKKPKSDELPAWRYLEPKDLKVPRVDNGRSWKFCTKCKCKKSGKIGLYILSHFDPEHEDNWVPPKNEGNLAAVDVPLNIPEATVVDPSLLAIGDDIEFQDLGAWCASVDPSGISFVPAIVERENVALTSVDVCSDITSNNGLHSCVECGSDWDPTWPYLWPDSAS